MGGQIGKRGGMFSIRKKSDALLPLVLLDVHPCVWTRDRTRPAKESVFFIMDAESEALLEFQAEGGRRMKIFPPNVNGR